MLLEEDLCNDMRSVLSLSKEINYHNELVDTTDDPELRMIYNEELLDLIDKFYKFEEVLKLKIEFYNEYCKKHNYPLNLSFFRILNEMKKAQVRKRNV